MKRAIAFMLISVLGLCLVSGFYVALNSITENEQTQALKVIELSEDNSDEIIETILESKTIATSSSSSRKSSSSPKPSSQPSPLSIVSSVINILGIGEEDVCWPKSNESNEGPGITSYCPYSGSYEECINPFMPSTVYAYNGAIRDDNDTDYCLDNETLIEYYLSCHDQSGPDDSIAKGIVCNDYNYYDSIETYCKNNNVWGHQTYHDYGCEVIGPGGACTQEMYYANETEIQVCTDGCTYDGSGTCNPPSCADECTLGETRCNGSVEQTCGDYDGVDSCTEWPTSTIGTGNEDCDFNCGDDTADVCNRPDLLVKDFETYNATPTSGDEVRFRFIIENSGNYDLTNVNWQVDTGEGLVTNPISFDLVSGETIIVYAKKVLTNIGNHIIKAKTDYADSITESNEANNEQQVNVSVG